MTDQIKNIIFDVGQVLIKYQPLKNLEKALQDKSLARDVYAKTFGSQDWLKLDRGLVTREELITELGQKYPELENIISESIQNWPEFLEPVPENARLLEKLSEKNYHLYYLSNFPREGFKDTQELFPYLKIFEEGVISGETGYVKPESGIYRALMEKIDLEPAVSLFIDDRQENLTAAEKFGFKTVHYTVETNLRNKLQEYQIKI